MSAAPSTDDDPRVRDLLSVPPKSSGAIEGGSAGTFDPAGMSEIQRRVLAQRQGDDT